MSEIVIPWRPVTLAPAVVPDDVAAALGQVDALRRAWEVAVAAMSDEDFAEARRRSLRRHAVETGIIERLYDLDWGVTEALVAEGISADVVAREGGAPDSVLQTITDQLNALDLVVDLASGDRPLSSFTVRELHASITRSQASYEAHDQFNRPVNPPLLHGEWKKDDNHVRRPDGSILQYTPADQVDSEMDTLFEMYAEQDQLHPIVRAAWLHHRFISIHPFQDGNGRVARALVLLELLRHRYAPLVVDRWRRTDYLQSLDKANEGDLWALTRLFAKLETETLRAELERPSLDAPESSQPSDVARAYAERVLASRSRSDQGERIAVDETARAVQAHIVAWLERQGGELESAFSGVDPNCSASVDRAAPGDGDPDNDRSKWWHGQVIRAARKLDFFTNINDGTWWTHLRLRVEQEQLRYLAFVQKVGHGDTGVLALSIMAEFVDGRDTEGRPMFSPALEISPHDSLTFTSGDDVSSRAAELDEVLERTLALSVDALGRRLS